MLDILVIVSGTWRTTTPRSITPTVSVCITPERWWLPVGGIPVVGVSGRRLPGMVGVPRVVWISASNVSSVDTTTATATSVYFNHASLSVLL